jgi:hypothetical protein
MLDGLFRDLPGVRAFSRRRPQGWRLANLTPASGRQDHTASPAAIWRTPCARSTAIAFHPAFVAIASRPSYGMERADYEFDLGSASSNIFEKQKFF